LGARLALARKPEQSSAVNEQLSYDPGQPPVAITYNAGPWIQQWRGNHRVLSYFGDVRKFAALPAGKPSGAWAQAIGLALQQWWREKSALAANRILTDSPPSVSDL
jgi:hypothetical protein